MNTKEKIIELRNKDYYVKLLNNFRNNGLYDLITSEEIDYSLIVINLLHFLKKNKKYIKNFQSKDFENILILCIDEILTKKFNIDVDHEKLNVVILLVKNSYLSKTIFLYIKDTGLKIYYKYRCNFCLSQNDDEVVEFDNKNRT
jgi:hypothetical protein